MPLYQGKCPECESQFEDFLKLKHYENSGLHCPDCGHAAQTVIQAVMTIGPMPSKPLEMRQIGQSFTSNGQIRRYKERHPDRVFVDKDSSAWRNHYDSVRNLCEDGAKTEGFRDLDHKKRERKREKNLRKALESGEKSPTPMVPVS